MTDKSIRLNSTALYVQARTDVIEPHVERLVHVCYRMLSISKRTRSVGDGGHLIALYASHHWITRRASVSRR